MVCTPLILLITLCSIFGIKNGNAQQILTKAEAVKTTLANNYDIRIGEKDIQIATNSAVKQNAGYLPTLTGSANASADIGGANFTFADGRKDSSPLGLANGANASLTGNYTIYDKSRAITLNQLLETRNLVELQQRLTMEQTLLQVFSAYYDIARQTQNLTVLKETIDVTRKRLERAQYRFDYGQGNRLDILNAEVDIQRDSVNILNITQQISNSKRNLNVIMGVDMDSNFEVDTNVVYANNLTLEELTTAARNNNVNVLLVDKNVELTQYDLQLIDAGRRPTVGASAALSYRFQDNFSSSFIDKQTSQGLNVGVNLNWNIFDGGRRKIQEQNTKVNIESLSVQREQLEAELSRDVANAWGNYQNALFVLQAEEKNVATSQENLRQTEDRFKAGQLNSVEFRQAQLNLLNARTNYNAAKFDAKILELQLLQLSGEILVVGF